MGSTDTINLPAVIDYTPAIAEYAGRPGVVRIHGCVVPFGAGHFEQEIDAGASVAEIVRGVCPHVSLQADFHICIDGVYIRPDRWAWTYPNGGAVVSMRLVPRGGGGGKDPLRTVLTLAVMAAAFMAPGAAVFLGLPPGFAAGVGGALITAGVGYVGMLAVNSIAPPAQQDFGQISGTTTDSPTYSITGARNRYRPWEAIPVVLGTHRVVADKVAATYTENVGDDQYLTMLFCFGYGPLVLRGFKIGENPLSSFDDYEIEVRQGFDDDDPITIYPESVVQDAESIALTNADGWVQRTTDTETDKISVDITCPQLVAYDSQGNKETETLEFAVQYAAAGSGDWSVAVDEWTSFAQREYDITDRFEDSISIYSYMGGVGFLLVMDRSDGRLYEVFASITVGFEIDIVTGTISNVPVTAWPIARVYGDYERLDDDDGFYTLQGVIVDDIRTDAAKSYFSASSDFAPSLSGDAVVIAAGDLKYPYVEISGKTTSTVRKTIEFNPSGVGQFDVRIKRVTADATDDKTFNKSYWTVLRSIKEKVPIAFDVGEEVPLALVALRIKATGQLNGEIDEFSSLCTRICDDYDADSDTWIERATDNPASNYRYVLQGNATANALSDSRVDIDGLELWHAFCLTNDYTIGYVVDSTRTNFEIRQLIAAAARAAVSNHDGKHGVIIDNEKSYVGPPVTPRNSWGGKGEKVFKRVPHAIRCRFADADNDYKFEERVVFDDGYDAGSATRYERMDFPGVTDRKQVYKLARIRIAEMRLRPEKYTRYMDVASIVFQRGDKTRLADTVMNVGLKTCRIKSVTIDGSGNATAITVDDVCTMEAGSSYAVRIYGSDHTSQHADVDTVAGENTSLTFSTPITAANVPAADDLVLFGISGSESIDVLVKSIRPNADLTAEIEFVPYGGTSIFDAASGTIPDFDPNITQPQDPDPPRPDIDAVATDESVLKVVTGGFEPRIAVNMSIPGTFTAIVAQIEVQASVADKNIWDVRTVADALARSVTAYLEDVERSASYDIRCRTIARTGKYSKWRYRYGVTVIGQSTPPPNVTAMYLENGKLIWDYSSPPRDFAGFRLRQAAGAYVGWDDAVAFSPDFVSPPVAVREENGPKTFLVKAEDYAGNQSETAAVVVVNLGDALASNVYDSATEAPDFDGTITGGTASGSPETLTADASGYYWLSDDDHVWWRADSAHMAWAERYEEMTYTFSYTPILPEYDLLVDLDIESPYGWKIEWRKALAETFWAGDASAVFWTGDEDAEFWSGDAGDWNTYTGRLKTDSQPYDIRITTPASPQQAEITEIGTRLDVDDLIEKLNDVTISASGTRLTLSRDFLEIKNISYVFQDDGGDAVRIEIADYSTSGPLIYARDASLSLTTATLDVTVQGLVNRGG